MREKNRKETHDGNRGNRKRTGVEIRGRTWEENRERKEIGVWRESHGEN